MHKLTLGTCLFVFIAATTYEDISAAPVLYVSDTLADYVAVVDTANSTMTYPTIPVSRPLAPVVSADGNQVYVQSTDGSISVIDAPTRTVVRVVDNPNSAAPDGPSTMTLSPDGTVLYAIAAGSGDIAIVDTDTGAVTARITGTGIAGASPVIRASHDGHRLFVLDGVSRTVAAIDVASHAVVGQVVVSGAASDYLVGLVVSQDDRTIYTASSASELISIDAASMTVASSIPTAHSPNAIDLSPDGSRAYIALTGDGCVADIDIATEVASATGIASNVCVAVAVGGNGQHVYLGSYHADGVYEIYVWDKVLGRADMVFQLSSVNFDDQSVSTAPVTPDPGIWWNPAESGRSFNIEVRHDTLVLTAQVYDSAGTPTWLLASGPYDPVSGVFLGEFGSYSGGQCLDCPYRAPDFSANGGLVQLVFSTGTTGLMYFGSSVFPIEKYDW